MPTYVYLCSSCSEELEIHQSFSDEPLTLCSKCGGELKKIIFASPVHYRGAGWNISDKRGLTGYKRKPNITVKMIDQLSPEER